MTTGAEITSLAETRLKEKYQNVLVPKNNPNWHGPWDCAEFASWVVYQTTSKLFGCINNSAKPEVAEAYSGAWARDAGSNTLIQTSEDEAVGTPGIILIRKPPAPRVMGHVAISDGHGKVVEAAGINLGVRRGDVRGRQWHYAVKIPDVVYATTGFTTPPKPLPRLLTLENPNLNGPKVEEVQLALQSKGFDPGPIDGFYGPHTVAAVAAFQTANRLISDGVCGPLTAAKLGVAWP